MGGGHTYSHVVCSCFFFFSLLLPPFALSVLQVLCRGSGLTHVHHGRARECHLRPGDTPVFCAAGLHHTEVAMVGGECWDRVLRLHRILGYKGLVYICVWEVSVCVCARARFTNQGILVYVLYPISSHFL